MTVNQTVKPSSVYSGTWSYTGGAGTIAVLGDSSDSSYAMNTSGGFYTSGFLVTIPAGTIPAGAVIKSMTVKVRAAMASGTASVGCYVAYPNGPSTSDHGNLALTMALSTTIKTFTIGVTPTLGSTATAAYADGTRGLSVQFDSNTSMRIYEISVDIVYDQPPSVSGVAISPAGAETRTTRPTITWVYSDPEGSVQQSFWVEIWDTADIAAISGFDPAVYGPGTYEGPFNYWRYGYSSSTLRPKVATGIYDTDIYPACFDSNVITFGYVSATQYQGGPVLGSTNSWTVPIDLPNNRTYKVFVWAADNGANTNTRFGVKANVGTLTFTLAVPLPPSPQSGGITVQRVAAKHTNQISVQANNNVLTADQSDFGGSTTGWEADANATLARNTTTGAFGSQSMDVTATAAGNASVRTSQANGSRFATPNAGNWTFMMAVRAAATARTVNLLVKWYDSANAQVGSTVTVASAADSTSAWTTIKGTVSKPPTATTAVIVAQVVGAAASEVHRVDTVGAFPGTVTAWSRGGLTTEQYALIERSTDGGTTWSRIRVPGAALVPGYGQNALRLDASAQTASTYDPTLHPGQTARYRFATMSQDLGYLITSPVSASTTDVVGSATKFVLRDPDDLTGAVAEVSINGDLDSESPERVGMFNLLGRANQVALSDVISGRTWPRITTTTKSPAELAALKSVRAGRSTLLLQNDVGSQWWCRFTQDWSESLLNSVSRKTNQYTQVTFGLVEQDAPVGAVS